MREALKATSRLRREATRHLAEAAEASGVQQLIAQSIAFAYRADGPCHLDDAVSATLAAIDGPGGIFNVVDDDPAPANVWIPALAEALGAGRPRGVPAFIAKAVAGDDAVRTMTRQRGASNARIKRELGWAPRYASWRGGFKELTPPTRT